MKDDTIRQNESISRGLEDFLEQQMLDTQHPSKRDALDLDLIPEPSGERQTTTHTQKASKKQTRTSHVANVSDDTDDLSDLRLFSQKPKRKSGSAVTPDYDDEEDYGYKEDKPKRNSKKRKPAGKKKMKTGQKNNRSHNKKKTEKKKRFGFLKVLCALIVILLVAWYFIVGMIYQKMQYDDSASALRGPVSSGGVTNILLIGNDARSIEERGRSDAMILLTISNKTRTVQMTSLLRDMYVDIPGHDGNRINAAYSYGGPELLCQTIEKNLGIEVNHYVIVNFHAFAALVDAVGGIDLEVSNEEVQWINAYLNEYNLLEGKEMTTDYLDTSLSGMIHLNGPQALAYSRNRYIGTDFGRTERQRKVLQQIMKKLPLAAITGTNDVINGLCPNLKTNLTQFDCYLLSFRIGSFLLYEKTQNTIPAEGTYSNQTIRDMAVLSVDFEENKKLWNNAVYGK